jgi:hypothetical protein
MGSKQHANNGCGPSFGNNFLTLFGLMLLDDEALRIGAEMDEEEDQDVDMLDMIDDDYDEPDSDPDDDYDKDEGNL